MTILFALLAVLSANLAYAFDEGSDIGAPQVQYLSWCEKQSVMEYDSRGNPMLKRDCRAEGLKCQQAERFAGSYRIVFAECK